MCEILYLNSDPSPTPPTHPKKIDLRHHKNKFEYYAAGQQALQGLLWSQMELYQIMLIIKQKLHIWDTKSLIFAWKWFAMINQLSE